MPAGLPNEDADRVGASRAEVGASMDRVADRTFRYALALVAAVIAVSVVVLAT